jgi:hypothetical protein
MATINQSQSTTTVKLGRAAKYLGTRSAGSENYPDEVFGVLANLLSPTESGRPETYVYEATGELRAATWTAIVNETVQTEDGRWVFTGRQVRWSWPGYRNAETDESELGLNIVDKDILFDDLFQHVYHYAKVNRRSKVSFVG